MNKSKIARLTAALQDELNERLSNNDDDQATLAWLNALPPVQAIVEERFQSKDQRDAVSFALEILLDARAKKIEADPAISYEQRIEILGQHIFGDLWKPRNIPGVVSLTPEQVAARYKTDEPPATAEARPANDIQHPTSKEHDFVNHADNDEGTQIKAKDGGLRIEDGQNQAENGKQKHSTAEARPANDVQHPTSKDHDSANHADNDGWTNRAEREKRNGPTRPKADGLKRTKPGLNWTKLDENDP